jgi:hypothetical protein
MIVAVGCSTHGQGPNTKFFRGLETHGYIQAIAIAMQETRRTFSIVKNLDLEYSGPDIPVCKMYSGGR